MTATPRARARSRRRRRHPRSPRAEVDKIESLDRYPFKIKLANDGAPTTKLRGCVTLTLTLCDPRTNEEIRLTPQSKKWCFPIAGYFGGESFEELCAGFQWIISEIAAVEAEGGVPVGDARVPIKVCFGIDLSAAWHSMVDCGGAIGSSTWPCFWCAWHAMVRSLGDPEGCSMCDEQCGHYDMDSPEKRARLKTRASVLRHPTWGRYRRTTQDPPRP